MYKISNDHSQIPGIKTISYALESTRYLVLKIWKSIPDELKKLKFLELFGEISCSKVDYLLF